MCIIICMRLCSRLLRKVSTSYPLFFNIENDLLMCFIAEVIDPSVTHKRIDIKEKHQEPSQHHGVTTNSAISVDEFKNKLDGEKTSTVVDGKAV